jgi:hypothetical protein
MTLNTALFYIGATIRMAFRYFVLIPAVSLFVFLVVISEFSFNNFFNEAYGYISQVSQKAAESPLHVNTNVCKTHSQPVVSAEGEVLPPPVKCDEWELKSVLIEDIAKETADTAYSLYIFLVIVLGALELGFSLMVGREPWLVMMFDKIFSPIERLFKKPKSESI